MEYLKTTATIFLLIAGIVFLSWLIWQNVDHKNDETVCAIPTIRFYTFKKSDASEKTIPIGLHNFSWTVQGGTLKGTNGNRTQTLTMSRHNEKLSGDLRKLYLKPDLFEPGSDEITLKIFIDNVEYIR